MFSWLLSLYRILTTNHDPEHLGGFLQKPPIQSLSEYINKSEILYQPKKNKCLESDVFHCYITLPSSRLHSLIVWRQITMVVVREGSLSEYKISTARQCLVINV